jgi:hypothetical protein
MSFYENCKDDNIIEGNEKENIIKPILNGGSEGGFKKSVIKKPNVEDKKATPKSVAKVEGKKENGIFSPLNLGQMLSPLMSSSDSYKTYKQHEVIFEDNKYQPCCKWKAGKCIIF